MTTPMQPAAAPVAELLVYAQERLADAARAPGGAELAGLAERAHALAGEYLLLAQGPRGAQLRRQHLALLWQLNAVVYRLLRTAAAPRLSAAAPGGPQARAHAAAAARVLLGVWAALARAYEPQDDPELLALREHAGRALAACGARRGG